MKFWPVNNDFCLEILHNSKHFILLSSQGVDIDLNKLGQRSLWGRNSTTCKYQLTTANFTFDNCYFSFQWSVWLGKIFGVAAMFFRAIDHHFIICVNIYMYVRITFIHDVDLINVGWCSIALYTPVGSMPLVQCTFERLHIIQFISKMVSKSKT